ARNRRPDGEGERARRPARPRRRRTRRRRRRLDRPLRRRRSGGAPAAARRAVRERSRDGAARPVVDSAPLNAEPHSYTGAGVSLAVAEAVVGRLRAAVESTGARGFGAFAGLHPLGDGRLLAASTDGVGTKLILARERGALREDQLRADPVGRGREE